MKFTIYPTYVEIEPPYCAGTVITEIRGYYGVEEDENECPVTFYYDFITARLDEDGIARWDCPVCHFENEIEIETFEQSN